MNIDELEKFTIGELSSLSIEELRLEAEKLIEKLRDDNRKLPFSAVEKLQEICTPLPEVAPMINKGMKLSDCCSLLNFIINYLSKLPEIAEKYSPFAAKIISFIMDNLN